MPDLHYFPLTSPFLLLLALVAIAVMVFVQLHMLRYAYDKLGMPMRYFYLLLFASLVGSYVNIPLATLAGERVVTGHIESYYGIDYVVPNIIGQTGTVIAINVGGALIPLLGSLYLTIKHRIYLPALLAVAVVAVACHLMAQPVRGMGIALPVFAPILVTAATALLISRRYAAPLAYIAGSMGTLVGADLMNLGVIRGLGTPVASIGGAGTFDGIFLTSILAVVLAGLLTDRPAARA